MRGVGLGAFAVVGRRGVGLGALAIVGVVACRDVGSAPIDRSVAPPTGDVEPQGDAPVRAQAIVTLGANAVHVDGGPAIALPPAVAPGTMTDDLRPSYVVAGLATALAPTRGPIVVDVLSWDDATVAGLRNVTASASGRALMLRVSGSEPVEIVALSEREVPRARIVPTRAGWEAWDGDRSLDPSALDRTLPIAIDPRDTDPIAVLRDASGIVGGSDHLLLALDFAPCVAAPPGMACVAGGPATVGSDDGPIEERPARRILVSTFYIDEREVTIAEHDACATAGGCKRRINGHQTIMKPFVGADQPAMPIDYRRAQRYCAWAGKRLPTEWEWEKAARGPDGDKYSWGDDEASCDRAVYRECAPVGCTPYPGKTNRWDCNEHATKPVGSFAAGHYGLFDMAGNGYEWTASVGIESIEACGDACRGRDPLGPCDGATKCGRGKETRVLRGGSWYWPKGRVRASHRRVEVIDTGSHRLGMRCVTTDPVLTTFPPRALTEARPSRPLPDPPSAEALAIFSGVAHDPIEQKPICSEKIRKESNWVREGGRSETTCRDPWPYLVSNEPRGHLWQPFLADIGGAYLGVGSDQNYTYIAAARSEWAWVLDYDPRVYRNHLRLLALVKHAATPKQFVELFAPDNERNALKLLEEELGEHPDWSVLRQIFVATREELHAYFVEQRRGHPKAPTFGWLHDDESYAYVRRLVEQGRLMPIRADLLGDHAIMSVAEAARKLQVPVRVFYTSNAPTAWGGEITDAYRKNLLALPFDARSIVLSTTPGGGFRQSGKWHHNVQWGRHLHELLARPGYDNVWKLIDDRTFAGDGDLTTTGLPSAWW